MLERIKYAREYRGLMQKELADKLGLSKAHYNQVENGKESLTDRTIKDICKALNINEEWLRTGKGPMDAQPVDELGVILDNFAVDRDTEFGKLMFKILQTYHDAPEDVRKAIDSFVASLLEQYKREGR